MKKSLFKIKKITLLMSVWYSDLKKWTTLALSWICCCRPGPVGWLNVNWPSHRSYSSSAPPSERTVAKLLQSRLVLFIANELKRWRTMYVSSPPSVWIPSLRPCPRQRQMNTQNNNNKKWRWTESMDRSLATAGALSNDYQWPQLHRTLTALLEGRTRNEISRGIHTLAAR